MACFFGLSTFGLIILLMSKIFTDLIFLAIKKKEHIYLTESKTEAEPNNKDESKEVAEDESEEPEGDEEEPELENDESESTTVSEQEKELKKQKNEI